MIAFIALLLTFVVSVKAQDGGSGCNPNPSCYNSNYSEIKEWAKAGRRGGIPSVSNIKERLNPGANIQNAINRGGSGVILLKNGTYTINRTINLKSGVVLRGQSKNGVKLSVKMKNGRALVFGRGVKNAGLENMRVVYEALSNPPKEYRTGFRDGRFCRECFQNDFPRNKNTLLRLDGDDNWVDNVDFINSGSDPVEIFGKHNTFRNSLVDNCYNKGGGGEGYFDIRGDYNLVIGSTVRKIRHFAIQNGAAYNVIFKNKLEVDINFHNGDDGHNLIEQNSIIRPSWHTWGVFATGGARYGHDKPGPRNIIVNNTTFDYRENKTEFSSSNVVYTYKNYGEPDKTNWRMPSCGSFYAVKCGSGGGGGTPTDGNTVVMTKSNATGFSMDGGNGGANQQNVYLWSRNTSNVNQQWEEINRGNGYYSYKKKNTNFCIDGGSGGAKGQNVKLYSCSDNNQNQHWRKVNVNGKFRLEKRNAPGFSIDGRSGGANEQNIYLWTSSNTNQNQLWNFASVDRTRAQDEISKNVISSNPVRNTLYTNGAKEFTTISIYDIKGAQIVTAPFNGIDFDVSSLENGLYIVKLIGDTTAKTEKIIIDN